MSKLRDIRKEKKLTLQQVADVAGITFQYLSHLETGRYQNPSRKVMEKIAHALGYSVFEIFFTDTTKTA